MRRSFLVFQPRSGLIDYLWTGEVALALLGPEPCGRLSQSEHRKGVVGRFFLGPTCWSYGRLWYFCVFIKCGIVTQCQPIAYPLSLSLTEEQ